MKVYPVLKRSIDIAVSLIGLIILSPLFLMITIWIKMTSPGPVVYTHTRIGKGGKPFKIYKFRTMINGARDLQNKGVPTEELITSAGKFLRKIYLDETLQLINILKGDVSLVGPRPLDKETFENGQIVEYYPKLRDLITTITPGMTSLESVSTYLPLKDRIEFEKQFRGLLEKDKYVEMTSKYNIFKDEYKKIPGKHRYILDSYYIKNLSLGMDLRILFYTFLLVTKRLFSKE